MFFFLRTGTSSVGASYSRLSRRRGREGDGISIKCLFSWLVWVLLYDKKALNSRQEPKPEPEPCLSACTLGDVLDVFAVNGC